MKKTLYLGASMLAVVAAAIVPASAADIYGKGGYKDGSAYAPVATWTGFYVGVNGGYGWANSNQLAGSGKAIDVSILHIDADRSGGVDPTGGFGGGQIGYNWQAPASPFVLGVEADIQASSIDGSRKYSLGESLGTDDALLTGVKNVTVKSSLDWFGTIRGRVGYAFDTSLIYFTGGFAFGEITNRVDETDTLYSRDFHAKSDGTATGYVLGGGYEYKFNPAWSLKAEYQYINLGKNDSNFKDDTTSRFGLKVTDDTFHTARVGLNYHVGRSYDPLK